MDTPSILFALLLGFSISLELAEANTPINTYPNNPDLKISSFFIVFII